MKDRVGEGILILEKMVRMGADARTIIVLRPVHAEATQTL
jgi:hypothetical protein